MEPDDRWVTNKKDWGGKVWDFYAASVDQGLLYHYCRYGRRNCTIIMSKRVFDYRPDPSQPNKTVVEVKPWHESALATLPRRTPHFNFITPDGADPRCRIFCYGNCVPPYSHFSHWTSKRKPWKQAIPSNRDDVRNNLPTTPVDLWWHMLYTLQDEYEALFPSSLWFQDFVNSTRS